MRKPILVGSRESALAVAQAMTVVDYLRAQGAEAELRTMKTTGDRILDRTLEQVGGKGLFVKELDAALREGRVDLCVHSLKDVPMETDPALPLLGFSRREDPRDALVLPEGRNGADGLSLPLLSNPIGSASLRRKLQLRALFPGCDIRPVRGNLQTRLRKLDEGQYGALVLAAAGLKRLGLAHRISRYFSIGELLPAAGQGILAVQGRTGEDYSILQGYFDPEARRLALCERAFTAELGGGCSSPVCAHARTEGGGLTLRGLYYDPSRDIYRIGELSGGTEDPGMLGRALAKTLRESGEDGV